MCAKIVKRKDFEEDKKAKGETLSPLEKSSALLGKSSGAILGRKTIEAQSEAEHILLHAEAEAKKIREEALQLKAEAEKIYESERKRGYLEGEKRGLALSSEKLVKLEALKEQFYNSVEDEVIRLSMAVAEKVIGQIAI
ncbi:MAG: hypothetical protein COX62_06860, partial [Deltaproteobacteria bacterium CG_4_10_14_0_2_um_filter_43_8]